MNFKFESKVSERIKVEIHWDDKQKSPVPNIIPKQPDHFKEEIKRRFEERRNRIKRS
jgi:hypothetical protein